MLHRYGAILITAWAFCGLPALCVAGLLEHPCASGEAGCAEIKPSDCSHETPADSHEHECGHETDCASDPCSNTFVRSQRWTENNTLLQHQPVVFVSVVGQEELVASVTRIPNDAPTRDVRLAVHQSDIPLLI